MKDSAGQERRTKKISQSSTRIELIALRASVDVSRQIGGKATSESEQLRCIINNYPARSRGISPDT